MTVGTRGLVAAVATGAPGLQHRDEARTLRSGLRVVGVDVTPLDLPGGRRHQSGRVRRGAPFGSSDASGTQAPQESAVGMLEDGIVILDESDAEEFERDPAVDTGPKYLRNVGG